MSENNKFIIDCNGVVEIADVELAAMEARVLSPLSGGYFCPEEPCGNFDTACKINPDYCSFTTNVICGNANWCTVTENEYCTNYSACDDTTHNSESCN